MGKRLEGQRLQLLLLAKDYIYIWKVLKLANGREISKKLGHLFLSRIILLYLGTLGVFSTNSAFKTVYIAD